MTPFDMDDALALIDALEKLLVCYRVGKRPSDRLLTDIGRLKDKKRQAFPKETR